VNSAGPKRSKPSPNALTTKVRSLLGPFLRPQKFSAGEQLWREGDEAGLLVCIDVGRVKVHRGQGNAQVTLYLFGPGDTFGFMPFLDGRPYPAGAQALTAVEAVVMQRADLAAAFLRDPGVALALVELLATRLREAFARIERSATPDVLPRVAAALAALQAECEGAVIELPVTARELANALDVVPESFSRAVTALVKSGVLHRLGPRRFQVLDAARLRQAAETAVC
jgi:CRP/FNR family transcriptional regulator